MEKILYLKGEKKMNNKSTMIASIVGFVVVALVLGIVKEKREKKEKQMTEECMNKIRNMFFEES